MTVVAAPAGSGKTILVRSWLDSRGPAQRAAWVSVERGERDAQRFWGTLVSELRAAAPADGTIQALVPTPAFDGEAVVRRLVSELTALERRLVLVIDDVHEIASTEITGGLAYLLDHLPGAVHAVLITRRDLQLGLHRRRLDGGLTEIRRGQLLFTVQETRQMLSASGVVLSDEGLGRLQDRTEGWAAGLRLAVVALAGHPDPERFVAEFSGSERTVAEYLLAEVLDSQPPEVRRLLVRASLLQRVNGPLGDLLTGSRGAERHLQALADAGGFVVPVDPARTWFRFHHLFADLLAMELRHTEPGEIPRLHLAAARWHAEHGHVIEAIGHAQAAGDREQAAGLLIEHYFSLTLDGRQATAHSLLGAWDHDSAAISPEIATVMASDQLAEGSLDQAAAYLALAERHAGMVPGDRRHRFDMALLVTRLSLARRLGDFRSVTGAVQRIGILMEPRSDYDISMHNDVRALMLMNLGIVEVWSGRAAEGARHLEDAGALAERIGRPYLQVGCQAHWASATSWTSFTRGREACQEAVALAELHGWGADPVIGPALVAWGTSLMQAGRLGEAGQFLARADRTVRFDLEPATGFLLHLAHGGVHLARGRSAEAIASFRAAGRLELILAAGSPLRLQLRSSMLHAMLDLGQVTAAQDALAELSQPERDTGALREVRARLALAEGDPATAADVLAPTLSGSAQVHSMVVLVRSLVVEALAREALGETQAAQAAVERALDLAEQDTLILPFLHTPSRELLERHPRHRTAHGAFIAEILDALSGHSPAPEHGPAAPLLEELSGAELRVLRYLPTNLPAASIAGEMHVSVNTVKTHMRRIYAKLGAHNRIQAVQRARTLGLTGHSARHD
ncbi:MAG: LuxR C-terminal-related transcriptional regulator [Actinomycetota bacterium]|nr:LuxR C-terminal-related transcriptional regulator [Actinomycetota bacterium]